MNKSLDSVILRYAGFGLLFLGVAYCMYLVRGALPVFITGGIIAYAFEPLLKKLESRGYSRHGAVGIVFLFFLLLFLILLGVLAAAWQQVQSLNTNFTDLSKQWSHLGDELLRRLNESKLPAPVRKSIEDGVKDWMGGLKDKAPTYLSSGVQYVLGSVGSIFISLVLVPIITLWFMLEAQPIRMRLLMLVPPGYRRDVTDLAGSINNLLGRYVRGQLIVCSLYGVLCTIAFEVLGRMYGMQYALVLGLTAGVLYIVPYIGMFTLTAAAAGTAYFTATSQPMVCAGACVACCLGFNLIIDYGVSPRVLGRGVGLHPLMVIFALLCGNQLGGPMGMIFAVPIFASMRVAAIYLFPQLTAPLPPEMTGQAVVSEKAEDTEEIRRVAEAEKTAAQASRAEAA